MTKWGFLILLGLVAVNLYITYRIASGLQSAQAAVTGNPLVKFFSSLGL